MNRRAFLAGLLAAVVVAGVSAEARMHSPYRGHRIIPANAAPLDGFTAPSGAYSFRKLISGYAGSAVRLRRASDNLELDVGFVGNDFNTAAATTHCAATTCFVRTWYAQAGTLDLVQTTAANQPQLIFNCDGALPCMQTTLAAQALASVANVTPATGIASLSAVAMRVSPGTGVCNWVKQNGATGNRITANTGANSWLVAGASGTILATANNSVWHATNAVINGASSVINVDGTEVTGTVTGSTVAGQPGILAGGTSTCNFAEAITWDVYQLTPAERGALQSNQKAYWGTP